MAALSPEELQRRIERLEKKDTKPEYIPGHADAAGAGTIKMNGSDDVESGGFVKMTINGQTLYIPVFRKVE